MIVGTPTKLNLIPSGVMPVVYINQGDAGYDKEFLIYNDDTPYNVPSGVSATIRGTKADGYGVTEAATITTGSNLVTVTITEQMVAAAGKNVYELVFVDTNDLRVASINMIWAVKKDALGDSVISDSDLDYATTVMDELQSVQAFKSQMDSNTIRITENEDGLAAETAARIAADNALQSNIAAEASARSTTDASLQSQINQLIAPSGAAPSAAEVQNARIGANGTTYASLGDAIRGQVNDLTLDIGAITGAEIVTQQTHTVTGTVMSGWGVNEPIPGADDLYIQLMATENVTTTGRKMWVRVVYSDDSTSDTEVTNVGEWYKVNYDTSKTFKQVNILFTRSDTAPSSSTTSTFKYVVVKGKPQPVVEAEAELNHLFVSGHIVGAIDFDTTAKTITIPAGTFYSKGKNAFFDVPAKTVSYAGINIYGAVVVDYTSRTYELYDYTSYRSLTASTGGAIIFFRKDTKYCTSPYQYTINGFTTLYVDKTLSIADAIPDSRAVGLLHVYAMGAVLGYINIDTTNKIVSVPAGTFIEVGKNDAYNASAAQLDYSAIRWYAVLVVNHNTHVYEVYDYAVYRTMSSVSVSAIMFFRVPLPKYNSSPYKVTIDGLSDIVTDGNEVPGYWIPELESVIDDVALLQTYSNGVTFGFITDIHWETNFQRSPELISYIANHSRVNMWLNGGDTATGDQGDGTTQKKLLYEAIGRYNGDYEFYSINGNHDNNAVGGQVTLTAAEIKNLIMPYENNVTFGNGNYYWFDYRGTRFVCLDTGVMGYTDPTQIAWAANVIQNSPLPVIIVMHIVYTYITDAEPCAFFNDLITAIGTNSNVKMIISGHSHIDRTFIASNGVPVAILDTDSKLSDDGISRIEGTISEQCFSIVTIDYDAETIHINRVGSIGSDIVINY